MTASVSAWAELMKAGLDLVQTSLRTSEMLTTSGTVITSRMGSMAGAFRNPWGDDHVELGRMMPEKINAFSDAAHALSKHWFSVFQQATQHVNHVSSVMYSGRVLNPSALSQITSKTSAPATSVVTDTLKSGSVALAPIHKQATSNARRLSPGAR